MPFNVIFAGTPDFSLPTLKALVESSHRVLAVYTQPDRPAGRHRHLKMSRIKEAALKYDLPVMQPENFKDENSIKKLKNFSADLMVVVAYGLILPKKVLEIPRLGCINIHASLLPRWRGASPIQQAILAGDKKSGVTIMQMDEGLDSGDILLKKEIVITRGESAQILHDRLSMLGAKAIIEALSLIERNALHPTLQEEESVTYAPKIKKSDAKINWKEPAITLERKIRAFDPWPIAYCDTQGGVLRIWEGEAIDQPSNQLPGQIVSLESHHVNVATGKGILRLLKLQFPGKKLITGKDFINAYLKRENYVNYFRP